MFEELKMVFQAHARVERYEVSDKFFSCKMEENSSVSEHILTMSGLHNRLTQLGVNLPDDAVIDRILQSLPPSYKSFVMNFNMQGMEKTIPEVFAMLKSGSFASSDHFPCNKSTQSRAWVHSLASSRHAPNT